MQTSLLDSVLSLRMSQAGLATQPAGQTGVPTVDPYAATTSELTQLSGYGQLLSATSQLSSTLSAGPTTTATTPQAAVSATPTVATATYTPGTPTNAYSLNVTQLAKSQTSLSSVFSDPNATIFNVGALTIQTGSVNNNGTFTADSTSPTTINVTTGSLNGIASAINASGAPVTASVVTNANGYGYQLQLTGTGTGSVAAFQLGGDGGGPLDASQYTVNALGLTQTQAAQNAAFTINGGAAQTSATNTNVAIDNGVTATLAGTGTTSIVAGNVGGVAQNLVNAYNALQGNVFNLTSATGALNANAGTANQLSTALQTQVQATYTNPGSTLTTLSQLGITAQNNAQATSPLTLNTTTFNAAFNADPNGTLNLLNQAVQQLGSIANGFTSTSNTNPSTGILAQQQSIETQYATNLQTANPGLNQLTPSLLNSLVQDELYQGSNALGLVGFSTYA